MSLQQRPRITGEEIIAAYQRTGSVWKAGKELGVAGQTVHARLVGLGYKLYSSKWTDEELSELETLLGAGLTMAEVSRRLGRSFAGVAVKASRLGLSVQRLERGQVKIPRGAGYDKVSILRHMAALERYDGKVTRYVRSNGLSVDLFVGAVEKHAPLRWRAYVEARSELPRRDCKYCEHAFIPFNARQRYCTRKCQRDAYSDDTYFGGQRRTTIGLAEGVCQICQREGHNRLASHHVYGKQNDPNNEALIALCNGCHQLVGRLAIRKFVESEDAWERLISLAWMRANGAERHGLDKELLVSVEIDLEECDETAIDEVEAGDVGATITVESLA